MSRIGGDQTSFAEDVEFVGFDDEDAFAASAAAITYVFQVCVVNSA